jgi:hypothetical protein
MAALHDSSVIEILVNPDGRLWIDVAGKGTEYKLLHAGSGVNDTAV